MCVLSLEENRDSNLTPLLFNSCLDGWAKQGVLLLNACLTVEQHKAGSHHKHGWEPFTQAVLRAVADDASHGATTSIKSSTIASMFSKVDAGVKKQVQEAKASASSGDNASKSKGVVFLAWGLPAQKSLKEAGITHVSFGKIECMYLYTILTLSFHLIAEHAQCADTRVGPSFTPVCSSRVPRQRSL